MSHRVHPKGFRLQEMKDWASRGFYEKNTSKYLEEDFKIRSFLEKELKLASVAGIEIERFPTKIKVIIKTSRPGLIIGRGGERTEKIKKELTKLLFSSGKETEKRELEIEIKTIQDPWSSAELCAQWIAQRIEKRIPYKRVLKQALSNIMAHKGTKGAKVQVSGRLDGVEMARTEWLKAGTLPRQTLRSEIDYGQAEAFCTYGVVGVKVWIHKGERPD